MLNSKDSDNKNKFTIRITDGLILDGIFLFISALLTDGGVLYYYFTRIVIVHVIGIIIIVVRRNNKYTLGDKIFITYGFIFLLIFAILILIIKTYFINSPLQHSIINDTI